MTSKKKAQGLPLNTIIIAAIVLIVLVVLWAIFTGRMGKFTSGLKTEEDKAMAAAEALAKEAAGGGATPTPTVLPPNCVVGAYSKIITSAKPCMCGTAICDTTRIYCDSTANRCY